MSLAAQQENNEIFILLSISCMRDNIYRIYVDTPFKKSPVKLDNIAVLSASRDVCPCWIPACAGMTG
ncbi:MAG: hypothetical protein M3A44_12650 [Gammaproteobacteria bacterium]